MRVLVTGAAGFSGSQPCEQLLRRNHHVVHLDNFLTGAENVRPLLDYRSFELLRHDICAQLVLQVDRICNLACRPSPDDYQYELSRRSSRP